MIKEWLQDINPLTSKRPNRRSVRSCRRLHWLGYNAVVFLKKLHFMVALPYGYFTSFNGFLKI